MLEGIPEEEAERINEKVGKDLGRFASEKVGELIPRLQALTNVFDPGDPAGSWSKQVREALGDALTECGSKGVELAHKEIIPHLLSGVEKFLCAGVLLMTRYVEAAKICTPCMDRLVAAQDVFMKEHPDVNAWVEEEFKKNPELFSLEGIRKLMESLKAKEKEEAGKGEEEKEGESTDAQPDVQ